MKFDHGQWQLLPGTQAIYPKTIVDVTVEDDALVISGYDHAIQTRSDYLQGTVITARFTSPMPDVIRVQLTHFKGRRERLPAFDLDYSLKNADVEIGQDDKKAWLKAGQFSVVVPVEGDWKILYYRGDEILTDAGDRNIAAPP
ncbi:MAG: hypothetical protein ABI970_25095, partial [Chloroflexota bacterium]